MDLVNHRIEGAARREGPQSLQDVSAPLHISRGSQLILYSPVSHPIVDPRKESICLLTKDPQRTYKDLIADNDIKFIHRVIGIQKLRGKHKAFEARRALLKEHGLFLADDRILPLLPKLLGSKFFEAKKYGLSTFILNGCTDC